MSYVCASAEQFHQVLVRKRRPRGAAELHSGSGIPIPRSKLLICTLAERASSDVERHDTYCLVRSFHGPLAPNDRLSHCEHWNHATGTNGLRANRKTERVVGSPRSAAVRSGSQRDDRVHRLRNDKATGKLTVSATLDR